MRQSWSPVLHPRRPATGPRLSVDDWAALPEDADGELVAGRLEEEEVPDPVHELAVSWLIEMFRRWLAGRGFVFSSDVRLAVSPEGGRKADVAVILPGSPPPRRRGPLRVPPDLLVEVVSPTPRDERRDRVEKMEEYAAFGVRWYWLLDPALGSLEVFERGPDGRYARALAATGGTITSVPGCPGLSVDVDALWSELERLGDED